MSNAIHRFREGNWFAFGILPDFEHQVVPGGRLRVKLISKAAPGLVGCSAVAGPRTMKGAGEHMPSELEDVIPGYEVWPSGYTVGPVASLKFAFTKSTIELSARQNGSVRKARLDYARRPHLVRKEPEKRHRLSATPSTQGS